ncbi:MAG TPA: hypothetical protein VIU93_07675 [Gallionellaceae bacterium]
MFGLIVLIVMVLYLSLLVWATRRGWRWGIEKKGWTGKKRYVGAAVGFLIVYLPVFWDWLPTVAVHQYYCARDAGFWVYKTLDQWKAENPGVMEGLVANKGAPSTRQGDMVNYTDTYLLNQRINKIVKQSGPLLFNRWRHEEEIIDERNNEVLARYINFSTSQERQQAGWNGWKFWLSSRSCIDGGTHPQHHFYEFENQVTGMQK